MSALRQRIREHRGPLAAVTAASGGALVLVGVGGAFAAGAVVGAIYFLERARRTREELTR